MALIRATSGSGGGDGFVSVDLTSTPQTINLDFVPSEIYARNKYTVNEVGCLRSMYVKNSPNNGLYSVRKGEAMWVTTTSHGITSVSGSSFTWTSEPNHGITGGLEYLAIP